MKNFLKNYLINIILGTIAMILLSYISVWFDNLLFWVIEGLLIGFAICLPKRNNDETKKFNFFTNFKIIMVFIMILINIYLLIKCFTATGWDSMGYGVLWVIELVFLTLIVITNFIIRIYYRIKNKQAFKKGAISNCIFIIVLILIAFCILQILSMV